MTNIRSLDALRGILACVVFLAHVYIGFIWPNDGPDTTLGLQLALYLGRLAVVFFFCLSGFVIARSIALNREGNGEFSPGEFALSRIARIAPPLLATIAITSLLSMGLRSAGMGVVPLETADRNAFLTDPGSQLLSLATLTVAGELQGAGFNGPMWSLTYEIRCYIFAALLAVFAWAPTSRQRLSAAVLAVGYGAATDLPGFLIGDRQQMTMLAAFAMGCLAYRLRGVEPLAVAAVMLVAAAVAFPAARAGYAGHVRFMDANWPWAIYQLAAAVVFSSTLVLLSRVDRLRALAWMGASGYTVYILHFPVVQALYFLLFHKARWALEPGVSWLTAGVVTVAGFVVCWAVALVVERPKEHRVWLTAKVEAVRSAIRPRHPDAADTAI